MKTADLKIILSWAALFIVAALVIRACDSLPSAVGDEGLRYLSSGHIDVWLDPESGCEYIRSRATSSSSFTPRLRKDGLPMCDEEGKSK